MTKHCELTGKELASLTDAQVVLALKGYYPVYSLAETFVGYEEEYVRPLVDRASVFVEKYPHKKETKND
jgi:hypothetical protein